MELDVSARSHTRSQFGDDYRTAHLGQCAVETQLLDHGKHVDRFLRGAKALDRLVDALVAWLIKALGLENVAHSGVGVFLKHQRAEHRFLYLLVLRHDASAGVVHRLVLRRAAPCASLPVAVWCL